MNFDITSGGGYKEIEKTPYYDTNIVKKNIEKNIKKIENLDNIFKKIHSYGKLIDQIEKYNEEIGAIQDFFKERKKSALKLRVEKKIPKQKKINKKIKQIKDSKDYTKLIKLIKKQCFPQGKDFFKDKNVNSYPCFVVQERASSALKTLEEQNDLVGIRRLRDNLRTYREKGGLADAKMKELIKKVEKKDLKHREVLTIQNFFRDFVKANSESLYEDNYSSTLVANWGKDVFKEIKDDPNAVECLYQNLLFYSENYLEELGQDFNNLFDKVEQYHQKLARKVEQPHQKFVRKVDQHHQKLARIEKFIDSLSSERVSISPKNIDVAREALKIIDSEKDVSKKRQLLLPFEKALNKYPKNQKKQTKYKTLFTQLQLTKAAANIFLEEKDKFRSKPISGRILKITSKYGKPKEAPVIEKRMSFDQRIKAFEMACDWLEKNPTAANKTKLKNELNNYRQKSGEADLVVFQKLAYRVEKRVKEPISSQKVIKKPKSPPKSRSIVEKFDHLCGVIDDFKINRFIENNEKELLNQKVLTDGFLTAVTNSRYKTAKFLGSKYKDKIDATRVKEELQGGAFEDALEFLKEKKQ